jgi:2-polyprenyl-3-methyl-5-hydroxy-6-metoxy-1,4-benzoquinol methylase
MNNFAGVKLEKFSYDYYWDSRGFTIRKKLFAREEIFFGWIKGGSTVLDVAVGNSYLPICLKAKKGCEVEVYDLEPKVIAEYEKNGIKAETKNIYDTAEESGKKYDYIIMSEILEHLPMPEEVIKKISERAKFLVISVPNSAFYRFRLELMFGRFLKQWKHHPSEHLRFWSHIDFLDWLDSLGFDILKCEASNGLDIGPFKFFKYLPNLCGHQICYLVATKKL